MKTPQEFQDLCHNLPEDCTPQAFCTGCEEYQTKLFGKSPVTVLKEAVQAVIEDMGGQTPDDNLVRVSLVQKWIRMLGGAMHQLRNAPEE